MKEAPKYVIAAVICLIVLIIPLPADSLFLRLSLKEAAPGDYMLH